MRIFLTTVLFFLTLAAAAAQCRCRWSRHQGSQTDTIATENVWLDLEGSGKAPPDLSALTRNIRKYRLEGALRANYQRLLDSLKNAPGDSVTARKIGVLEAELNSHFQILRLGDIEFAFYSSDTVRIGNHEIIVYFFSSDFKNKWNEDSGNWMFCYTEQFGILNATYRCIWSDEPPCRTSLVLVENCKVDKGNRAVFTALMRKFQTATIDGFQSY